MYSYSSKNRKIFKIIPFKFHFLRYEVDNGNEETLSDMRQGFLTKLFNTNNIPEPTYFTSSLATFLVTLYSLFCILMALVIKEMGSGLLFGDPLAITLLVLVVLLLIGTLVILVRQPISKKELHFKVRVFEVISRTIILIVLFQVPFTPWLPALSILINIYLMLELDYMVSFGCIF